MQFAQSEILQLAGDIWSSVLGLGVELCEDTPHLGDDRLTGCVQITGAWQGSVTLDTSRDFSRMVAAKMFNIEIAGVTDADLTDALAELANMLGGNLKSILPGPSHLALPTVTEGLDYDMSIPGTRRMSEVWFATGSEPVCIQLFEHDDSAKLSSRQRTAQ